LNRIKRDCKTGFLSSFYSLELILVSPAYIELVTRPGHRVEVWARWPSFNIYKNYFITSNQENQSSQSLLTRQKYYDYDKNHFYQRYFYLFSTFASEYWILKAEIIKMIKKTLNENKDFVNKIRKIWLMKKKKKKKKREN